MRFIKSLLRKTDIQTSHHSNHTISSFGNLIIQLSNHHTKIIPKSIELRNIYIYARIVFCLDASTDGRAPSSRPSSVVVAYYSTIMNIIISLLPFNFPRFLLFELFRFDDASFLRVSSHHRFSHHVERHVFSTRSIHQCHSISHGFCSNFFAFMTLRFFASLRIAFLMSSASSPSALP